MIQTTSRKPDEIIYKLKWITQVLALPEPLQYNFFPSKANLANELIIHWKNSYSVVNNDCEQGLNQTQKSILKNINAYLCSNDPLTSEQWENVRKLAIEYLSAMNWGKIVPSKENIVFWPWQYNELIYHINELSDPKLLYKTWIKQETPQHSAAGMHVLIDFLYDYTLLAQDPVQQIGWIIKNTSEAHAISKITKQIDRLLEIYGDDLTSQEYIEKPEWADVVKAAQTAKLVFGITDTP